MHNNVYINNGVNGTFNTECEGGVAPGLLVGVQQTAGLHQATEPMQVENQACFVPETQENVTGEIDHDHATSSRTTIGKPITLEPYEPKYENRKKQKNKEKRIKHLLSLEETFNGGPNYPRFQVLTFPGVDINTELNLIRANSEILNKIGKPKKISKMNKRSLLIEVHSSDQLSKLASIKKIADHPVTIQSHRTMNSVKGTIYSMSLSQCKEEEIQKYLSDQKVTKVERMKTKINGTLMNSHRYILTFESDRLPRVIKLAEWHHELVEVYIPRPLRCIKCQKLGHLKKFCRRATGSCANCCQNHMLTDCINEPYCINCNGIHRPSDRNCPSYQYQCEILATQAREHITRIEAEQIVKDRYVQDGRSYATVVRQHGSLIRNV